MLAHRGAAILAAIKSSKLTKTELAKLLHVPVERSSLLLSVSKAMTHEQLDFAASCEYGVDHLRLIVKVEKQVKNPDVNHDDLRMELLRTCANFSYEELKHHLRTLVAKLNDGHVAARKSYLRYSKLADADGMKYLNVKLPAADVERLHTLLTPMARDYLFHGQAVDEAEGHAFALRHLCLSTPIGENSNPLDLRYRPCILIPLDDAHLLESGEVANTDGEILNLADLLDARLQDLGYAVVCMKDRDGIMRPQKAVEIQRTATDEQRFLTIISHLICQQPDCFTPAVRCEIHHIQAFSRGGPTVLENLCPLCRYHNLENDDDPTKKLHGRVFKDPDTKTLWFDDAFGDIRRNRHPVQQFNGLAVAARMRETHKQ